MASDPEVPHALPYETMINEYRLDSVLGQGGFGITYKATDTKLGRTVAIKEYLPALISTRHGLEVVPLRSGDEADFSGGLRRFVEEARTLARFRHPNIVNVLRFIEANGTAYLVMEFEAGMDLGHHLNNLRRPMVASEVQRLADALMDGLETIHRQGFLHRDIKPQNIIVRPDGVPVLIDFGAARLSATGGSRNLTAIVSAGYAPLEQYFEGGHQGPWSDIYALGGVLYRVVTGRRPPDAPARVHDDSYVPAMRAAAGRCPEAFLAALDWALRPVIGDRPQTVSDWRAACAGTLTPPPARGGALAALAGADPDSTDIRAPDPLSLNRDVALRRSDGGRAARPSDETLDGPLGTASPPSGAPPPALQAPSPQAPSPQAPSPQAPAPQAPPPRTRLPPASLAGPQMGPDETLAHPLGTRSVRVPSQGTSEADDDEAAAGATVDLPLRRAPAPPDSSGDATLVAPPVPPPIPAPAIPAAPAPPAAPTPDDDEAAAGATVDLPLRRALAPPDSSGDATLVAPPTTPPTPGSPGSIVSTPPAAPPPRTAAAVGKATPDQPLRPTPRTTGSGDDATIVTPLDPVSARQRAALAAEPTLPPEPARPSGETHSRRGAPQPPSPPASSGVERPPSSRAQTPRVPAPDADSDATLALGAALLPGAMPRPGPSRTSVSGPAPRLPVPDDADEEATLGGLPPPPPRPVPPKALPAARPVATPKRSGAPILLVAGLGLVLALGAGAAVIWILAPDRIAGLLDPDSAAWTEAEREGTRAALERYLAAFPQGAHRAAATERLEVLAAAEARAAAAADFAAAKAEATPSAWRDFLARHPDSAEATEARAQLDALEQAAADDAAWASAQSAGTAAAIDAYLARFPAGRHGAAALEMRGRLAPALRLESNHGATVPVNAEVIFKLAADEDLHAACYYLDGLGQVARLFPNRFQTGTAIGAEAAVTVPDTFEFAIRPQTSGVVEELWCVSARTDPLPQLTSVDQAKDLESLPFLTLDDLKTAARGALVGTPFAESSLSYRVQ